MAEHPLTHAGFTSGWLQRFFNAPFDPICVMLAMRTKLLLDVIDEMGHSYNLLRGIGYGWIDFGDIPGETPGDPDSYFPPLPPITPPGPGEPGYTGPSPGPGEPGYVPPPGPPMPGEPGYVPPGPGEPGYIPPGPGEPGYIPPPPPPSGGFGGGGGGAGSGGPGGPGGPGSGTFSFSPGDFSPTGPGGGSFGGISVYGYCCYDDYDPPTLITIVPEAFEMNCEEAQELYISGNPNECSAELYEWKITEGGGSLSAETGESVIYTAPACGEDCPDITIITLSCVFEVIDTIDILINTCPKTASIDYTSKQMTVTQKQTLKVVKGAAGCGTPTYEWEITAGGGSLSAEEGEEVEYEAPADNAECANNPTITLSCAGKVMDMLNIAVNAMGETASAVVVVSGDCAFGGSCTGQGCPDDDPPGCGLWTAPWYCGVWKWHYRCDGILPGPADFCAVNYNPPFTGCAEKTSGCTTCGTWNGIPVGCAAGKNDTRSAAMKTAGCCPMQLL